MKREARTIGSTVQWRGAHRPRGHLVRLGLLLVVLLTATACGTRWDDDQRAAVLARYEGDGDGGGTGSDAEATGTDDEAVVSGESGGGDVAADDSGGSAVVDGGGANGDPTASTGVPTRAGGPAPCAAPSDAPGVSDTEIAIGSISSLSGPVPGLGESGLAAVRAYIEFRNATGGVCGRRLVVKSDDDGTDNGRFRSILNELDGEVLAWAGGVTAGDAGGADLVDQLQVPFVTTAISEVFQNAAYVFDLNPPFEDVHQPIGKYDFLHDEGVRTAAVVLAGIDQTRSEAVKQIAQMEASGIRIVHRQELPISTLSYDSAARGVANSGADYLLFIYDATASASMAQSMEDTGYDMRYEDYLVAYGTNFVELAGGAAAEGATSWIRFVPNEETGTSQGQTEFLEWMDRVAPGVARDGFAVDSWAGARVLVEAIEALPGPIARDALYGQLQSVETYDADGLIGPVDLGGKRSNGCFIGMIVRNGTWTRLAPGQGFLC